MCKPRLCRNIGEAGKKRDAGGFAAWQRFDLSLAYALRKACGGCCRHPQKIAARDKGRGKSHERNSRVQAISFGWLWPGLAASGHLLNQRLLHLGMESLCRGEFLVRLLLLAERQIQARQSIVRVWLRRIETLSAQKGCQSVLIALLIDIYAP